MGLEPYVVLKAHLGQDGVEQLRLEELQGVDPDDDGVGLWRQLFERKWRELALAHG
jgi:hypothetical protein